MPVLNWVKPRKGHCNRLLQHAVKTMSSNGEDGILRWMVNQFGMSAGYCVEFGAWDGKVGSNTWALLQQGEWRGLLIEADSGKHAQLAANYAGKVNVKTVQGLVGWEGDIALDRILARHEVPKTFELLSIDIDGNDYHVWAGLRDFSPSIVVIEFNNHIPNDIEYIQDADFSVNQGSSLRAMVHLGKSRGYELACTCGGNAFFVRNELYPLLELEDNSLDAMFDDTRTETKIFQLYDNSLGLVGKQTLNWSKISFTAEDIQIVPPELRFYGKRLDIGEQPMPVQDCADRLAQGEALFGQGRLDEARAIFLELTHAYPDCHDAWNDLGVLYYSRKELHEALQAFRAGLALQPADENLTTNCMQTLVQLGWLEEAHAVAQAYLAAGGGPAAVESLVRTVNARKKAAPATPQVAVIPVDALHRALGLQAPLEYPREFLATPLDRWKMEVNDSPIFRYLYRQFKPRRHLEFGTWQGAGVVYCLEESAATVWTINLPFGEDKPEGGSQYTGDGNSFGLGTAMAADWARRIGLPDQPGYRTDCFGFIGRFYLEKGLGNRVCQIYCDSTQWDDSVYPDGFFDTILIDGGHTADIVASDTKKALRLLRPGGLLLWHDFCPPVADKFPVTRGVRDGLAPLLPLLHKQCEPLAWIKPSWILMGKKK